MLEEAKHESLMLPLFAMHHRDISITIMLWLFVMHHRDISIKIMLPLFSMHHRDISICTYIHIDKCIHIHILTPLSCIWINNSDESILLTNFIMVKLHIISDFNVLLVSSFIPPCFTSIKCWSLLGPWFIIEWWLMIKFGSYLN